MIEKSIDYRDFFSDGSAASIQRIYANLFSQDENALTLINWQQEEYIFNQLFVGPDQLLAPPYASVWLTQEPRLLDEHTLEVRALYQLLGLAAPAGIPDDFLPLELDAFSVLAQLSKQAQSLEQQQALQETMFWLVCTHWQSWLPSFIHAALQASKADSAITKILLHFQEWLFSLIKEMSHENAT